MLLLHYYPKDNPIKKFLQNRGELEAKNRAIELIRDSSIVQECYDIAANYGAKACQNLNLLPDNASRQVLIDLAGYIVGRKK
jgi:geranylgeranyl pyrophosphate synthase